MSNGEKVIIACSSCGAQYNVFTLNPGAKFRCQKCKTINIVPESVEELPQETAPEPPARPQIKPTVKTPSAQTRPQSTRTAPPRISSLKNGKPAQKQSSEDENIESDSEEEIVPAKKSGKKNRKYLYIGIGVLIAILAVIYIIYNNNQAEKNRKIAVDASGHIKEINQLVADKDYVKALEKSRVFVEEFKKSGLPDVKSIGENIGNLEKIIELGKEGEAKLQELINKKKNSSVAQYPELLKEFQHFISRYTQFDNLIKQAEPEVKEINEKIADAEKEEANTIFETIMAEVQPLCDAGKYDDAIARLKEFYEKHPKKSKYLESAMKREISEIKKLKSEK